MLGGGPGFKWMSRKTMKDYLDRGTNDKSSFFGGVSFCVQRVSKFVDVVAQLLKVKFEQVSRSREVYTQSLFHNSSR